MPTAGQIYRPISEDILGYLPGDFDQEVLSKILLCVKDLKTTIGEKVNIYLNHVCGYAL